MIAGYVLLRKPENLMDESGWPATLYASKEMALRHASESCNFFKHHKIFEVSLTEVQPEEEK